MCDDPVPVEIPGDPDTVARFASAFKNTAEALRDAARELRSLANENITISLAVDEVREKADEVSSDTGKVAERYQGAGDTFSSYSNALASARDSGNGARNNIRTNNEDARYWRHRERDLRQQVAFGSTDAEVLQDLQEAARRAHHYDSLYSTYVGTYAAAIDDRDAAVTHAVNGLANAEEAAGLNDGLWDGILGDLQQIWELISKYLGPILEILRNVLEIIKKIVDLLALIVSIASLFFPVLAPLAAALTAVSVILGVAIFACSALLFLMGRETLGRVVSDGIGALVGVITSKAGGINIFNKSSLASGMSAGMGSAGTVLTGGPANLVVNLKASLISNPRTSAYMQVWAKDTAEAGIGGGFGGMWQNVASAGLDFDITGSTPAWDQPANANQALIGGGDVVTGGSVSPVAGMFDWNYDFAGPVSDVGDWGAAALQAAS